MSCKFIFAIYVAVVIIALSFGDLNIAEFYKKDFSPTGNSIKTVQKKNVPHCALECSRTEYCQSFSFRLKECILWQAKFVTGDKNNGTEVLMPNTGYVYYHFNPALNLTFVKERLPFDQALQECRKLKSGNLVVIRDQKMVDRVLSLVQGDEAWIGMNGTVDGGGAKDSNGRAINFNLHWVDGRAFTIDQFHKFHKDTPSRSGKACGLKATDAYVKGDWIDDDCNKPQPYVCQYTP